MLWWKVRQIPSFVLTPVLEGQATTGPHLIRVWARSNESNDPIMSGGRLALFGYGRKWRLQAFLTRNVVLRSQETSSVTYTPRNFERFTFSFLALENQCGVRGVKPFGARWYCTIVKHPANHHLMFPYLMISLIISLLYLHLFVVSTWHPDSGDICKPTYFYYGNFVRDGRINTKINVYFYFYNTFFKCIT